MICSFLNVQIICPIYICRNTTTQQTLDMNLPLFPLLFTIIFLIPKLLCSQVTLLEFPKELQLYGRDLQTNVANVRISGIIEPTFNHTHVEVVVLRNNQFHNSYSQPAVALDTFEFNIPIKAELANYTFSLIGSTNGTSEEIVKAEKVVAGDAYIIQGQSNAEAFSRGQSTTAQQNDFLRVHACGIPFASNLVNLDQWFIGQGDGNRFTNGNVGQWGIQFANELILKQKVPIAIFNGAHGGMAIAYFQRPLGYDTSLVSNYGRLHLRIKRTNLQNHIRAVIWSQGEQNGLAGFSLTAEEYMAEFELLKNAWKEDYPNIEKIYIFQTHNGCNKNPIYLMPIKEAQRRLGDLNSDIETISTARMIHFNDECHFNFTNGYEEFGNRLFRIVDEDLYGSNYTLDVRSPQIVNARLIFPTTIQIETSANLLMSNGEPTDFEVHGLDSLSITHVYCAGPHIYITLSEPPNNPLEVSYYAPPQGATGNFIVNPFLMEPLSFYHYPVENVLSVHEDEEELKIGYDAQNKLIQVFTENSLTELELMSISGQSKKVSATNSINVFDLAPGNYLLKVTYNDNSSYEKIVIY